MTINLFFGKPVFLLTAIKMGIIGRSRRIDYGESDYKETEMLAVWWGMVAEGPYGGSMPEVSFDALG